MKRIIFTLILTFFCFGLYAQDNNAARPKNGYELFLEKRYQESLASLENERKEHPDRIDIYVISGWCYRDMRDYPNMERISKEGLKVVPTDARTLRNLSTALYWQGKYSEAASAFEGYLKSRNQPKTDSYYFESYYKMGICYYNLKQWLKSDICFSLTNTMRPNNIENMQYLGEVKERIGEYQASYDLFEKILKYQPNNQKANEAVHRLRDKLPKKS